MRSLALIFSVEDVSVDLVVTPSVGLFDTEKDNI